MPPANQRRGFRILLALLTLVMIDACASKGLDDEALEVLHGLMLTETTLKILVSSHGCTRPDDFTVQVEDRGLRYLSIIRNRFDGCRRRKHSVQLVFELDKLGIDISENLIVQNPVKAFSRPGFVIKSEP